MPRYTPCTVAFYFKKNTPGFSVFLSALFFLFFKLARPISIDPDSSLVTVWQVAGVFSFFWVWVFFVLQIGKFTLSKIVPDFQKHLALQLTLGAAIASLLALLLGYFGLCGPTHAPLWISLLFIGIFLGISVPNSPTQSRSIPHIFGMIVFALVVLVLMAPGAAPQFHSDPLYYQQLGPRLWFEAGRIELNPRLPVGSLMASYWECLQLWGQVILGGEQGRGLFEGAIFAQWIHTVLGLGVSALLCSKTAESFLSPRLKPTSIFIGIFALTASALLWTAWLGKNDWGVISWSLAALFCWIDLESKSFPNTRRILLGGFFAGMAMGAKLSAVFFIGPIVSLLCTYSLSKRTLTPLLAVAASTVAGMAPVLWIKYALTGNPFFPFLSNYFYSPWLSKSMITTYLGPQGADGRMKLLESIQARLSFLLERDFQFLVSIIVILVALTFSKFKPRLKLLAASQIITVVLFFIFVKPSVTTEDGMLYLRFLGATIPLILVIGAIYILEATQTIKVTHLKSSAFAVTLGSILFFSMYRLLPNVKIIPYLQERIERIPAVNREVQLGGGSKAWLRLNALQEKLILTTGDSQLYFVANLPIADIQQQPQLHQAWFDLAKDPAQFIDLCKTLEIRYVLDTRHFDNSYWSGFSEWLDFIVKDAPEAILYQDHSSRIIDLKALDLASAIKSSEFKQYFSQVPLLSVL